MKKKVYQLEDKNKRNNKDLIIIKKEMDIKSIKLVIKIKILEEIKEIDRTPIFSA